MLFKNELTVGANQMSNENDMDFTLLWKYLLHHFLPGSQTERTRKWVSGEILSKIQIPQIMSHFHLKSNAPLYLEDPYVSFTH